MQKKVGQEKKSKTVKFTAEKEDWNRYTLEDGNVLEIKLVLLTVVKYPDEIDELGIPHYVTRSANIINAIVPEKEG